MAIEINRLLNANMYSEGKSLLGKVEEITVPSITAKDADVNVLGLQMTIKLPSGFEAMAGKVKFNAVYPDIIGEFGSPYVTRKVQVRGNLQTYTTEGLVSEVSAVIFMTIRFKTAISPFTFKVNDNIEQEADFNCSYYRLEIDGERMIEFDAFANLFFIRDQDQLAQYRINLGF